ncbi:MAG: Fe(3+) ABC transporter substrate-binding protein [Gammaproteobacteria bacterium]|nr:Fe(3+) ABC transporter substrate-binding protein [Gammaproteobacteria bacterium]|tara:strand:- start:148865 stop:149896 length:1032 start_codon:yes stop_codon:yes gene_type:complete
MKNISLVLTLILIGQLFFIQKIFADDNVVNIYSARKNHLIKPLLNDFTKITSIKTNVVSAKAKVLQKRLLAEGSNSQADVLLTVDAGNLFRAKNKGLLKKIRSDELNRLVSPHLRDREGYWYALSIRSRVIMYNPEKISPKEIKRYESLANPNLKGRVCMRSSGNIYNQSLLASLIHHMGQRKSTIWAKNVVNNFARKTKGNDRTQMTSVVLGECDVTIANTYYLGKWMTSKKENEKKYSTRIKVLFPNQNDRGSHINISGAAVTKHAKNTGNAIKLIEYLASDRAQEIYAKKNHEYPIRNNIPVSEIVKSWGYPFIMDKINLDVLGVNNSRAVKIFDEVGWR